MISDNMLEHIRKFIEEGELFAAHVPIVKQLLESFDEQTTEIAQLRASRLAIVESLDAVMSERDLLKARLSGELSGLVDVDLLMSVKARRQ